MYLHNYITLQNNCSTYTTYVQMHKLHAQGYLSLVFFNMSVSSLSVWRVSAFSLLCFSATVASWSKKNALASSFLVLSSDSLRIPNTGFCRWVGFSCLEHFSLLVAIGFRLVCVENTCTCTWYTHWRICPCYRGVLISEDGTCMYRLQWSWDLKMCPY